MATNLTINGISYPFPDTGDEEWGDDVDSWAAAVSQHLLQQTGGSFTLSAEVDFGATYGLKTAYYKSRTANPSTTGIVRLANNSDAIGFRNAANNADILLKVNASDQLALGAAVFVTTTGSLTASRMMVTDGSANIITNSVTAVEAGYLSGVTSAIQTQITTATGNIATNTTNIATVTSDLATHTALTTAHGATGANVGTTNTQTLTNKTLTSPTINGGKVGSLAKTAIYTVLSTDDFVSGDATSGAFTLTLPAASTVTGHVFNFKKIDTSSNAVTVASSDNIDGSASTTLSTQYESLQVISNGTTYLSLARRVVSEWVAFTCTMVGTTVTAYTNTTTVARQRRVGDSVEVWLRSTFSANPGAGSGRFEWPLPSGVTPDTAKSPTTTFCRYGYGNGVIATATIQAVQVILSDNSPTRVYCQNAASGAISPGAIVNTDFLELFFIIPVTGWKG